MTKSEQDVVRRIVREEIKNLLTQLRDESYSQHVHEDSVIKDPTDSRSLGMFHASFSAVVANVAMTRSAADGE